MIHSEGSEDGSEGWEEKRGRRGGLAGVVVGFVFRVRLLAVGWWFVG